MPTIQPRNHTDYSMGKLIRNLLAGFPARILLLQQKGAKTAVFEAQLRKVESARNGVISNARGYGRSQLLTCCSKLNDMLREEEALIEARENSVEYQRNQQDLPEDK